MKIIYGLLLCLMLSTSMTSFVHAEDNVETINSELLNEINELRQSKGLSALTFDSSLNKIADVRAEEASSCWSHTRPNGKQGVDMISANKWRGENLAYIDYCANVDLTLEEQILAASTIFHNYCASPTHYDNLIYSSFTKIGISTYVSYNSNGDVKLTMACMFSS